MPMKNTPSEVYYDIHGRKVQWALEMMLVEANKSLNTNDKSTLNALLGFKEDHRGLGVQGEETDLYVFILFLLALLGSAGLIRLGRFSRLREKVLLPMLRGSKQKAGF